MIQYCAPDPSGNDLKSTEQASHCFELIDSSAVVTLVKATRSAQSEGKGLGLCHVNSQVRMILELTQMDRFVQMYKSETEFRQQHQMMAA